ncbi:MAG: modB [Marmoricola sp.]|nr:modB [Marmoricola sp.]
MAAVFLVLPLVALVWAAPLGSFWSTITTHESLQALRLSVFTSTVAAAACVVLGLPLAWILARLDFPGRQILRGLVTVPLVLPPVVAGVALLSAFGRMGLIGKPLLDLWDIRIPYTTFAVVIAHTFVSLPFFVISVEGALRATPKSLEVAAATLGADRWTTFRRVTLPLAMPGVVAGVVLAWARSLGEFGATITFAGNYPGTTRTMPLEVYTQLQGDQDTATALSLVLLIVCIAVLVCLRERWLGVR